MAKILIVDDEPEVCSLLEGFLAEKGYEVVTATRGRQALDMIKAECPQLVLLDVRMPEMEGIDVLRAVKALSPSIGVIMVTAVHDEAIAKRAITEGAYDYITKPIDLSYLELSVITKITDLIG